MSKKPAAADRVLGWCGLLLIGLISRAADRIAEDRAAGRRWSPAGLVPRALLDAVRLKELLSPDSNPARRERVHR